MFGRVRALEVFSRRRRLWVVNSQRRPIKVDDELGLTCVPPLSGHCAFSGPPTDSEECEFRGFEI